MSTDYALELGVGDLEPPLEITLALNGTGFALEVTDVVAMRWRRPDGNLSTVPMTVHDAPGGVVRHAWEAGETDAIGVHKCEVLVTRAGRQRTFPSNPDVFSWRVNASV